MNMNSIARLRKRLRVLWAATCESWHQHHCDCGVSWYCCAPKMCRGADVCVDCEERQMDAWEQEYEKRMKGVA